MPCSVTIAVISSAGVTSNAGLRAAKRVVSSAPERSSIGISAPVGVSGSTVELGATTYVFWGGREGVETDSSKDPLRALGWYADAINFLCSYVKDQGYDLIRIAAHEFGHSLGLPDVKPGPCESLMSGSTGGVE